MDDTVKNGIGYCRVSHHVIPVGRRVLRGYDDGFPFMPVLDNFEQYGTFLGVKRYKEQVVKDKQLAPLNLLELRLECTLDLGHFQGAKKFWGIGIESAESPYARLVAEGTGRKLFPVPEEPVTKRFCPLFTKSRVARRSI